MLNCPNTAKHYSLRMQKILFHRLKIAWGCRRDQRTFQNYLSRIPSIGTITFTLETSAERWRIVATWKSCRRGQRKSRVWRGREKGDRRRGIGLGEDCIPRVKSRGSRDDAWHGILAAFVEARGWEQLGAELFIELCSMVRRIEDQLVPFSSPRVVSRRCLVRFEDIGVVQRRLHEGKYR